VRCHCLTLSALLAALSMLTCTKKDAAMERRDVAPLPISCALDALTKDQRRREGELLELHLASIRERKEREDGYSFRYDNDAAVFAQIAELVSLEHQCCPFLDFKLEWAGGDAPPWLHITGGARVKPFVAETFGTPFTADASR
jgi:hypothetical protein